MNDKEQSNNYIQFLILFNVFKDLIFKNNL